ncbi:conserved hypothetical protein [uncultured Pleomorphomonas sp.]|uniref:Uncharacterized protein n=1 Tax=uncultured Pleomorphomonas sp. TaxID=442121 RepID=A0A212LQH0_9HYPH|nr:hypothetical protein [uncultured Pleomorphomonas sp.]SCM79756.1 conserved hypothetical protein [uncultured Pleomorphomonas sp.]
MPVVPTYEDRGIRLDPGLNFRDTTRATGEMFGSGIGEALGSVGRGLIDIGQAVAEVKDLDATNEAKDSNNTFMGGARELSYGKSGYMGTSGRAAVEGLEGYKASLLQLAKDGAAGLSPLAQRKYWDASNVTINNLMDEASRHAMTQRGVWTVQTSKARVDTFRENAAASWDTNDEKLDVIAGFTELQNIGGLLGLHADDLADQSAELISGVYEDRIVRKAETDPIGAAADIESQKGFLLTDAQNRLKATVGEAALDKTTWQDGVAFAERKRKPADAGKPLFAEAGADATGRAGPTPERALLLGRITGDDAGKVLRLDSNFATNLSALMDDAPPKLRDDIGIRFPESEADGTGRTVDLTYKGESLSVAPLQLQDWARRNAERYGLRMPVGGAGGSVVAAADGVTARALAPSSGQIDKHLAAIADPRRRDIARQAILGTLEQQSQQELQQQMAAKAELWRQVGDGVAPDQVPFSVRQGAGSDAVASARSYAAKTLAGPLATDEVLLRDIYLYAASRPEDFARLDLNDYRDRLEGSDLKALAAAQSAIGQDSRKARDQGAELASAFDLAKTRLEEAGAIGSGGGESAEQRQLLAQVQNALYDDLAAFRKANPSTRPTTADFQKMINPHILGYYITPRPAAESGAGKPVRFGDISPNLRDSIARQLQQELGRQPTDGEVAREYQAFRLAQGA